MPWLIVAVLATVLSMGVNVFAARAVAREGFTGTGGATLYGLLGGWLTSGITAFVWYLAYGSTALCAIMFIITGGAPLVYASSHTGRQQLDALIARLKRIKKMRSVTA